MNGKKRKRNFIDKKSTNCHDFQKDNSISLGISCYPTTKK